MRYLYLEISDVYLEAYSAECLYEYLIEVGVALLVEVGGVPCEVVCLVPTIPRKYRSSCVGSASCAFGGCRKSADGEYLLIQITDENLCLRLIELFGKNAEIRFIVTYGLENYHSCLAYLVEGDIFLEVAVDRNRKALYELIYAIKPVALCEVERIHEGNDRLERTLVL